MPLLSPQLKAVMLCAFAYLLFTVNDALRKHLMGLDYDVFNIFLWSELFGLLTVLTFSKYLGGIKSVFTTKKPMLHLLRALSIVMTVALAIYAFGNLPMVDTYTIIFASPMIIVLLSSLVFKEVLSWNKIIVILIGFVGVIIALEPDIQRITLGHLAALGVAIFHSSNLLLGKALGNRETKISLAIYPSCAAIILSFCMLQFSPTLPATDNIPLFALGGIFQATATICIAIAFTAAPGATLAPIHYSQLIWGALIGFFVFGDIPSSNVVLGAAVIVLSGLYLIRIIKPPLKRGL